MKCLSCNQELVGRQSKYCCSECKGKASNNVHQVYKAQQKRGIERKIKLVEMFGGKCKCCSYDRNYAALSFHHKNPETKSFSLDLRNLSNKKWELLIQESEKCELLCMNCHMELHHFNHNKIMVGETGVEPAN